MSSVEIITLPPERWREAKALRLEALRRAPAAFASSLADEQAFSDDVWLARLTTAFQRDYNMTWYAEHEADLVGMAGANWSSREKTRHVAMIYGVYVSPARRGQGIATELLSRLLDELSALPQLEKVSLSVNSACAPAVRLYQRFGFEKVGTARRDLCVDGQYHDLVYMERCLRSSWGR